MKNKIAIILFAFAGLLMAKALYIPLKAEVSQVLLTRAFETTLATGKPTKAWAWADTRPVAKLEIKRIAARAIVLSGSSGEAMAFGPTLQNETARIGTRGTAVISAHRDTHFAFLKQVEKGDVITLTRDDGLQFTYHVTGMKIVDWNNSGIDAHANGFNLALSTCYPFDGITRSTKRYVVEASL